MVSETLNQAPRALTIAGSDSGGGAGIQADLKTFSAFGVYGASAITAVTAQNTVEVRSWLALPPDFVASQVDAVLRDIGADAVKTGMLGSAAIVHAVAEQIRAHEVDQVVVDPVLVATSGDSLADGDTLTAIVSELLPLALIVTPNIAEAEALTGESILDWEGAKAAAVRIAQMGARNVVITGGEFDGTANATDLFYDGSAYRDFTAVRVGTTSTHGTGCTFSAAIAAGLAKGLGVADAVALAKSYVTLAIQHAYPIGHGHGPLHHFYRYWQPSGSRYRPGVAPR